MSSVFHEQASHYAAVRARLNAPQVSKVEKARPVVRSVIVRPEGYVPPPVPKPPVEVRTPRDISEMTINAVLADAAKRQITAPPQIAGNIIKEVAEKHKVSVAEMRSPSRRRPVVIARREAYYRLRKETKLSLPQIAKRFGDRDHTTILHGIRSYEIVELGQTERRDRHLKRIEPIWGQGGWHK